MWTRRVILLGILLGVAVCGLAEEDAPVDTPVGLSSTESETVASVEAIGDSSRNSYQGEPRRNDEQEEEECTNPDVSDAGDDTPDDNANAQIDNRAPRYYHLVVLVHGYMGSEREQAYLSEALVHQSELILQQRQQQEEEQCDAESASTCNSNVNDTNHKFVVMRSKANAQKTMDGVAKGGERLAQEVYDWMQEQAVLIQHQQGNENTIMTLSFVSNSLGGLYSRYAVAELQDLVTRQQQQQQQTAALPFQFQPLLFCTTSSPHLGTSRETFIRLPAMAEILLAKAMQQTGADLFGVDSKLVTSHMCSTNSSTKNNNDHDSKSSGNRFLQALSQFQKRIAVANAYNTDFLVSVTSGAFLASSNNTNDHSPHFVMTHNPTTTHHLRPPTYHRNRQHRLMNNKHVALQVVTAEQRYHSSSSSSSSSSDASLSASKDDTHRECAHALDRLGWHKIFLDTRDVFPAWSILPTPTLSSAKSNFSSHELREHFSRYGTLLPFAHPINMANAKTDWYRELTKLGRPIMDSLAELLILDMIELSTRTAS